MNYKDLLNESYINLFSDNIIQRLNYANEVYDMLQTAYNPIGGLKTKGLESVDSMIDNIPFWKLAKKGDEVVAVILYKNKDGRKRIAMATNGTSEGKRELARMIKDEYKTNRSYAEISDGSLRFHERILGEYLDTISIPAHTALEKINDPEKTKMTEDYYEYERLINGEWIRKRMVGNVKAPFEKTSMSYRINQNTTKE